MAAENRSAHPNLPGVPWWGAVLIAVIATTIGFAFDAGSGNKDLGNVFAALYAVGCVAAVLAVRQSSIFTAVIQPPLILFVAVPGAYFLFHGAEFTGIKDTLINFGYPLIERFPLMLFTSAGVLLIGLVRWYFAMSSRSAVAAAPADADDDAAPGLFAGLAAKLSAVFQPRRRRRRRRRRGTAAQAQHRPPRDRGEAAPLGPARQAARAHPLPARPSPAGGHHRGTRPSPPQPHGVARPRTRSRRPRLRRRPPAPAPAARPERPHATAVPA